MGARTAAAAYDAERLIETLLARRSQTWMRAAGAVPVAALFGPSLPVVASVGWVAAYELTQAVEWLLMRAPFVGSPVAIRRRLCAALAVLFAQNAVLGGLAILTLLSGSVGGLGAAMLLLAISLMIAVVGSQGSRSAFIAALAPHATYLTAVLPLAVLVRHEVSAPQALLLSVSGATATSVAVVFWRSYRRLLMSEAQARQHAQSASAAKSVFIATVSHELRTPLSAIHAGASELERTAADPAPRRQAALVVEAARMMRALLDDLLDVSKVEAGRMDVETIPFDVRATVADTLRFWQGDARRRQVRLRLRGSRQLPKWVTGDPTRFRQVLNNLFSNALKFCTSAVDLTISVEDTRATFSVSDDGAGMTSDQMTRLFQHFSQADASVSRTHGGTGLGLVLSRDLARLMGGDLLAQSVVGEGATFTLSLPLTQADAPSDLDTDASGPGDRLAAFCALVVDDHEINRRAMGLILEPFGAEVTFATDGLAALEALAERTYDVVLLDLNMPGMDGLEVARRVRQSSGPNRSTPMVAVTGAVEARDRQRCLHAGMDECVAKPIEPSDLHAALLRVLAPRAATGPTSATAAIA